LLCWNHTFRSHCRCITGKAWS